LPCDKNDENLSSLAAVNKAMAIPLLENYASLSEMFPGGSTNISFYSSSLSSLPLAVQIITLLGL